MLDCYLGKSQRDLTNKAWVVVQLATSVLFLTVRSATADWLQDVKVAILAKASSVYQ